MKDAEQLLESPATTAQQAQGDRDLAVRRLQRHGWLTVRDLAEDLRFTATAPSDPDKACRSWLQRHRIPSVKRGRRILVSSVDVERELRKV